LGVFEEVLEVLVPLNTILIPSHEYEKALVRYQPSDL
jgi:hypothetical protein